MAVYITTEQAQIRSRREWFNLQTARSAILKSASTDLDTLFDIFLSHSFEDAEIIAGVKGYIEDQGLSVYVDWVDDSETDRSHVTPATADMLRRRMNHCESLLYISSDAARRSRWMPWELGYFDGRKPGKVGIVPIVQWEGAPFEGQEYLGLYPHVEMIDFQGIGKRLGQDLNERRALPLVAAVRGSFR